MSLEETIRDAVRAEIAPVRLELERATAELAALRAALPAQLVSIEEASGRLALSVSTVRRRVRDGSLPSRRVGRRVLVDLTAATREPSDDQVREALRPVKPSHAASLKSHAAILVVP